MIIAKTAGYCMGVKRAIEIVIQASDEVGRGKIFTWGPLIHNPQTVELLEEKNIFSTTDTSDLEEGDVTVIRSHGVTPDVKRAISDKKVKVVDATCPKVSRIQTLAKKYTDKGYSVVIIGDKGHAEVEAILGYTDNGFIVANQRDIDALPELGKTCVLSQSTFNREKFEYLALSIKERFPETVIIDTLCDSTSIRQKEVIELANQVDALVIVGGKNSANTKRLYEIASETGKPSFWVETAEELDPGDFEFFEKVGVTAGASTPHWIILKVVEKIEIMNEEHIAFFKKPISKFLGYFILQFNLYKAGGVVFLTLLTFALLNKPVRLSMLAVSFFYILAMYILYNMVDWQSTALIDPYRLHFYRDFKTPLMITLVVSVLLNIFISRMVGVWLFFLMTVALIIGILLTSPRFSRAFFMKLRFIASKKITTSKDAATAFGMIFVSLLIPIIWFEPPFLQSLITILFVVSLVMVRVILFSLKDIKSDMVLKRTTIPIIIGFEKTKILLSILLSLSALVIIVSIALKLLPIKYLLLLLITIYYTYYSIVYFIKGIQKSAYAEISIDGGLYFSGFIGLLITLLP
ncbi:4-hydroxy-3-methylbut-2-enyl diphosphate reductase [bacterium]|nr:4-hydroxy-3-methylbut-2-enyl diphosphate reductase [bacterium]